MGTHETSHSAPVCLLPCEGAATGVCGHEAHHQARLQRGPCRSHAVMLCAAAHPHIFAELLPLLLLLAVATDASGGRVREAVHLVLGLGLRSERPPVPEVQMWSRQLLSPRLCRDQNRAYCSVLHTHLLLLHEYFLTHCGHQWDQRRRCIPCHHFTLICIDLLLRGEAISEHCRSIVSKPRG